MARPLSSLSRSLGNGTAVLGQEGDREWKMFRGNRADGRRDDRSQSVCKIFERTVLI